MIVRLTLEEVGRALTCAYERWSLALRGGRQDTIAKSWTEGLLAHYYGALGELAVGKALGLYVPLHVNQFSGMEADIPYGNLEVRYRKNRDHDLIVRERDRDDRNYVLCCGEPPEIEVVGYMPGSHAKREEYLNDHGGHGAAYFVPRGDLWTFTNLLNSRQPLSTQP